MIKFRWTSDSISSYMDFTLIPFNFSNAYLTSGYFSYYMLENKKLISVVELIYHLIF